MKGSIAQEWANRLKVLRTGVRLKYALLADNELNRIIDEERKKFYAGAMKRQLPLAVDVPKAVTKHAKDKPRVA